jgi:hypothetical protein
MSIPEKDQKLLFMNSGKRCAFPECRFLLVAEASPADRPVILGEMAHIVAESPSGPRGNKKKGQRKVVWQPRRRATGEPRDFWIHRAVGLSFLRASERSWVLSVRPSFHLTVDGIKPAGQEHAGQITRKMSRMFNFALLGEIQFWRDYLGQGRAGLIFPFGQPDQQIRVSMNLLKGEVSWPGIPAEYSRPFKNAEYGDELFAWLDDQDVTDEDDDEDDEERWFASEADGKFAAHL